MVTFSVLGAVDLRGPDRKHLGSPISGSKRLALLSYLAVARPRGLHRRDTLVGLFWPDSSQKRARNSLSNMLHHIRRSLGPDTIVTRGDDEVGLARESIWCDAVVFDEACEEGRFLDALDLYRGDLLEGFFAPGAGPAFESWLHLERTRLRRQAVDAARAMTEEAEKRGDQKEAIRWGRRIMGLDPYDERSARRLMRLLLMEGDRGGALQVYEDLAQRLGEDFGATPSRETRALLDSPPRTTSSPWMSFADDPPSHSIAVLPFHNLSGSAEVEPFSSGLHDDLITELSRISDLTVISRTSVLQYRETKKSAREIGQELGVGTIVEGAVQKGEDRLRLNIQMIDARSDTHVWAERYDRQWTTAAIFDIQTGLAMEIARATRTELTPEDRDRRARETTESLEAYRLCAQGRAELDRRTEAGMRRAEAHFRQAISEDPDYPPAWVGRADALTLLFDYGYEEGKGVLVRAEEAVGRALELKPDSPEAHASLGLLQANRRQGPSAIENLGRAIDLRPNYAEAHNWSSWVNQVLGKAEEALADAERAVRLNPLSPEAVSNLAFSLLENGRAEPALREARRVRSLQPEWTTGPFCEGMALYHLQRFSETIEVLSGLSVPWAGSGPEVTRRMAQALSGDPAQAEEGLSHFQTNGDLFAAGLLHAALGAPEKAVEHFLRVEDWSYWPVFSVHHFYPEVLQPVRADPRFQQVKKAAEESWRKSPA